MRKTERQKRIVDLVSTRQITSQEELSRLLLEYGYSVTQASISRDLEELRIGKINGHYEPSFPAEAAHQEFGTISVATAGENLVVVKSGSGLASAAAVRIDSARIEEVIGTIAGDDTIFIAVGSLESQLKATKKIKKLLGVG